MKSNKMKKFTTLLIIILVIIILIGCQESSPVQDIGLLRGDHYYDVQQFHLDIDIDFRQSYFFIHHEQLYLFLLAADEDTLNSYIHLFRMDADGTDVQKIYRTLLDESVDFFNVLGFENCDDGYITLVTADNVILAPFTREDFFDGIWDFEIEYDYVYRSISPIGEVVYEFSIDALTNEERQFRISDVAFDFEGNAVASVSWLPAGFERSSGPLMLPRGIGNQSFLLFDRGLGGDFHELENLTHSNGLFNITNTGQIIVPSHAWLHGTDLVMFHEIDFENTAIIDGPVIKSESPFDSINGVFPASEASEFDYYIISNEREFVGYRRSDGTFTLLIDFLRLGVPLNYGRPDRNNFLLWDDGRITTVNMYWNSSLGRLDAIVFLLTPSTEPNTVTEREIITFGGVEIAGTPLIDKVAEFNRQSDTHQIEVVNYSYDDMDRLRTELIAGRGPDIFITSWVGGLAEAMGEGPFLLDLYQMIDTDPDINREDFFPGVLSTWENSRGELVQIAPSFSIQTMVGMQSVFPEAPGNWNYADFMAFYEDARTTGYDYPLGLMIDRLQILTMLLFADDTFFCEQTAVANFDSESFINVLNFVMTIPERGWEMIPEDIRLSGQWDEIGEFLKGEQLLLPSYTISESVRFRALQMRLGGITAFGFPSINAPVHAAFDALGTAVGIRSNSPHIEAAWEFVRLSLLPGNLSTFHDRLAFPLRIDQFEQLISREKNRTGPTITASSSEGSLEIPPMTESDAELLRDIISNIGHKPIFGHPIQNIVNEDAHAFFAGTRSAEDTARIIQSRVQRYLHEQQR
jgi:ABC-type glycerol-3-phosphate transport system substrate-binding protein